mgnify:CR=1 FL=1
MFCVVWYHLQVHTPSNALTYSNRFGFASIVETMDYSDEDSDYADESSNGVNDVDMNSTSHNAIDLLSDNMTVESPNESDINDTTIGVISKFHSEPYTNLPHCLLTYGCLSSLQSTLNRTKSISMKLQKKEERSFLHILYRLLRVKRCFEGGGLQLVPFQRFRSINRR